MPKSIKEIAFVISLATLVSKFGGMARQLVIAGAFGISAAYDAYNYAVSYTHLTLPTTPYV